MSVPPPPSPPALMPHVAAQQELMRVYREELHLQQCLKEQCRLLRSLTEAAAGLFSWWREGAAAATAGTTGSDPPVAAQPPTAGRLMGADAGSIESAPSSASSLLGLHAGMVFYSLGELLQLWAATADFLDFAGNSDTGTDVSASAAEATSWCERDTSRRDMHPSSCGPHQVLKCSGGHPPPWTFPISSAVQVPLTHGETGDAAHTPGAPAALLLLPTPAQLIRYRVLDAACPLPVTHRLLLGSVDANSFSLLLLWVMKLTKECAEAMLLCRPDRRVRQAHPQSARIEGQLWSSAGADSDGRSLRAVSRPMAMHSEADGTIGTKRPPSRDEGDLMVGDGTVVSESWKGLCAALIRIFTFLVAAAEVASPLAGSECGQSAKPPLSPFLTSCMASAAKSTSLRADLRLFLAEVAEVHDIVLEVMQYCDVADTQGDEGDPALKRPRGESPASAVLPPLAKQGKLAAMRNMALLAHLADIVDAQVRTHL
ncbi:hypothetical protein LSCM1_05760 [Leishmania martiniquensis]|uniref:Uncharacterized protein n=1 Tax=Leishmania martiniquensis TaxID=1580590 RepID=A0A836KTC8_9TRYP|nr:hypothetical protein LSCM1_05760 [Leishmania martiniquensis]